MLRLKKFIAATDFSRNISQKKNMKHPGNWTFWTQWWKFGSDDFPLHMGWFLLESANLIFRGVLVNWWFRARCFGIPFHKSQESKPPGPKAPIYRWKNIRAKSCDVLWCYALALSFSFPEYSWHVMVWQNWQNALTAWKKTWKCRIRLVLKPQPAVHLLSMENTTKSSQMLMFSLSAARLWPSPWRFTLKVASGCCFLIELKKPTGNRVGLWWSSSPNVWAKGTHQDPICQALLTEHFHHLKKKLWEMMHLQNPS